MSAIRGVADVNFGSYPDLGGIALAQFRGQVSEIPPSEPRIALSPCADAAFRLHQVAQNIVDTGQMAFALCAQPIEYLRVETDAYRNLAPGLARAYQLGKLFFGQSRNILVFLFGQIESSSPCLACAPNRLLFGISPVPVPDIFGSHSC